MLDLKSNLNDHDLLTLGEINSYLSNDFTYNINIFPEISSTNTYILDNVNTLLDNTIIATEMQTAGRGRFANTWHSDKAVGLTFSLLKFFNININIETLPLVIAVAIKRLLQQYQIAAKIKWPNDICAIDGSKIAGILLEGGILNNQRYVIIGIGINDNFNIKRSLFLASLLKHLHHVINEFLCNGFTSLCNEWLDNCIHYNKSIGVYQNGNLVASGLNIGVSSSGAILVKTLENKILEYASASIRFEI